jgi:hypothetical protein
MRALHLSLLVGTLCLATAAAWAIPETARTVDRIAATPPSPPGDGVRPEDVMIDGDAIGDVWDTTSPADAMGITDEETDLLPAITAGQTSAELLQEQELLRPPRPAPVDAHRIPTRRWSPHIPIQTLFYLMLAVVVVAVLLLKARG